ncbi:hypothetical protein [Salegentibacter maritimus]|uniref:hypothetical protein n=1 Tax=Salegentibacter maritimus TaxID=2794347 RepID=UPI0018E408C9|nr:hypothetical protein [Salegentibacter maritimus]MBI6115976.1 hypothetical protein [Salegentibacter maritimus]
MKNIIFLCSLAALIFNLSISKAYAESNSKRKPVNYTVVLDLSDRVLNNDQLQKDFKLIRKLFREFETKARRGLILTSKDRFAVRIIPQKGSPLDIGSFEDQLQINLDEIPVQNKNKRMEDFVASFEKVLDRLEKQSLIGKETNDFFGVDIWAYMNDNADSFSKPGYKNLVLIATDGYFDFESRSHVMRTGNRYTSTQFMTELTDHDWKEKAEANDYGLIPIELKADIEWIVSGISSKDEQDILQNKKIIYIWEKWLRESGASKYHFILNNSGTQMASKLLAVL